MRTQLSILGVAALASTMVNAIPSTLVARAELPQITAVQKPRTCSSYPTYNAETLEATEFSFYADSTEEPIAEFAGTVLTSVNNEDQAVAQIGIAVRPDLAKSVTKCFPDGGEEGLRVRAYGDWRRLTIAGYADANYILVAQGPIAHYPMTPYSHFYANGTQQPGTFIGNHRGSTTWAFKKAETTCKDPIDQYRVRLLETADSQLVEGEFRGFLRAGPAV